MTFFTFDLNHFFNPNSIKFCTIAEKLTDFFKFLIAKACLNLIFSTNSVSIVTVILSSVKMEPHTNQLKHLAIPL